MGFQNYFFKKCVGTRLFLLTFFFIFSYKCDDYISNDVEYKTIDKIRQNIIHLQKQNNVEVNGKTETVEESKDDSDTGNSTVSSVCLTEKPPSPIGSVNGCTVPDVVPTSSFSELPNAALEGNESKPSKNIKVRLIYYPI